MSSPHPTSQPGAAGPGLRAPATIEYRDLVLLVLQISTAGALLMALLAFLSADPALPACMLAAPTFAILTLCYQRGWEPARHLAIVALVLIVGSGMPEPYVSQHPALEVLLPPILALALSTATGVIGATVGTLTILIIRAGGGTYAHPMTLISVVVAITGLLMARFIINRLQHRTAAMLERATEQTRELASQRDLLQNDIRARLAAEAALRESERRFRLLAEHTSDIIALLDMRGQPQYISPSVERVLGYEVAELLDGNISALIHPEDRDAVIAVILALDASAATDAIVTYRVRRRAGDYCWLESNARALYDEEHDITRIVVVSRDVTARKLVEQALVEERASLAQRVAERTRELQATNEALARAARLKDEFLAAISHELRTPLSTVIATTESLQEGVYGTLDDPQRTALQTLEASGRQLLNLINDLLDLSQIIAGRLTLDLERIPTSYFVQSCVRPAEAEARRKHIDVATTIDPAVTSLLIDERRMRQVLVQLLLNAVKFTPAGGRVGLEVQRAEQAGGVRFTVWDTGIGISPADQERMFEPFVQLSGGLTRTAPGTGLGLALASQLVQLHGGTLHVESAPGQGSHFSVVLPQPGAGEPATAP